MKERIDILLVNKGFFLSRERAKSSIMAGIVYVDKQRCDKAGSLVDINSQIYVKENLCPYVSRGGLKLEKAFKAFDLDLKGLVCMDIGASTGGFTDFMLQNGVSKVYAVDVGYGQLDWKLRNDPRVINMEKINVRYLDTKKISELIDFISIDVSFISLKLVFPIAAVLLKENGYVVCLVKPQFEAGRSKVGKNGIVRDQDVQIEVLNNVAGYATARGLSVQDITYSPVTGAKGNIEYLLLLKKAEESTSINYAQINKTVQEAHESLGGKL